MMRRRPTTTRMHLEVDNRERDTLDRLQKRIGAKSRAEVIRRALIIMNWILDSDDRAFTVVIDGEEETVRIESGLLPEEIEP